MQKQRSTGTNPGKERAYQGDLILINKTPSDAVTDAVQHLMNENHIKNPPKTICI